MILNWYVHYLPIWLHESLQHHRFLLRHLVGLIDKLGRWGLIGGSLLAIIR
jgi:hypothetical protein